VTQTPAIALIDGEHHPSAVRAALDKLEAERGLAGVVFCGGEEKLGPGPLDDHYGRHVETDAREGLTRLAGQAGAVVDLADEPVLAPPARLRLAALALHLGLSYETPGMRLTPPSFEALDFAGPKLAVIGSGKRTGKTAVAGHWAGLLRAAGTDPVMVCMGRGGPAEPQLAEPGIDAEGLLTISRDGRHAASDYLEDAALAGVHTVGCRRVGGGMAGEPAESNVPAGAALAASLDPGVLLFEGSGSALPPVEVDATVCVTGRGATEALGDYRLLRARLALVGEGGDAAEVASVCRGEVLRFTLSPEPTAPLPEGARVALFSTGPAVPHGVDPVVTSSNLARRGALAGDLERAAAEGCDVYLTELKAAAIDTVAEQAQREGASIVFLRNVPQGIDGDLDEALMEVWRTA
jgi:cyclic 2,3-diphosphoglycerate synthetase